MQRLLYSILLLLLFAEVSAQTGKEFWFVAPDATNDHNDQPIHLNLSAYNNAADVMITQPANPAFVPILVNIPASQSVTVDLTPWINQIESTIPDVVLNNGLLIQATNDISAYYEIAPDNNTDIFSLKAENALGTEFLISAQTFFRSATKYNPAPFNSVGIVATQDNTALTITPTNNIVGHLANVPFTLTLNRGETFTLKATGPATNTRFGGTEVLSDKPIAITIADDSVESSYGGCKDMLGDQTIPIEQLGKEYILVRGFLFGDDKIYAMGVEDGTSVDVDGGAWAFNLNRGETQEISLSNPTLHLLASADIYVMHVTGFGCEVGTAIVPSIYCTGSPEVSFVRSKPGDFHVVVYVRTGAESSFTINGNPNRLQAKDFIPVPGTNGDWMAARKSFNAGQIQQGVNYRVHNTQGKFHFGIINGGQTTGTLYGYFTDFSSVDTEAIYRF